MNRLRLQYLADKLKISLSGHWVLVVCSVITLLICLLHALYAGCYSGKKKTSAGEKERCRNKFLLHGNL